MSLEDNAMKNRTIKPAVELFLTEEQSKVKEPSHMSYRRDKAVPKKIKLVSYSHNPDLSYPQVGDTVAVCHRSNDGREQRAGVENRKVKAVYMSDSIGHCIKDNAGDVWHVRPASVGGQKWETFTRGEKQKVLAGK